jgi:hypothetical protein
MVSEPKIPFWARPARGLGVAYICLMGVIDFILAVAWFFLAWMFMDYAVYFIDASLYKQLMDVLTWSLLIFPIFSLLCGAGSIAICFFVKKFGLVAVLIASMPVVSVLAFERLLEALHK